MIDWTHSGPVILAAFLASLVEFVEALTIVLAVGTLRGWKAAMVGTVSAAVFLAVLVLIFGPSLQRIPVHLLQWWVGVLLLLFGLRWLRKAILRSAGVISMHDEEKIYARETERLQRMGLMREGGLDMVAVATSFKAVALEGLEVVFIVVATGALGGMLIPATLGAAAAGLLVIGVGAAVHRPLAQVPENTLKFSVGLILSTFGVFWLGEGLGVQWPGEDASLFGLFAGFVVVSQIAIALARRAARLAPVSSSP